METVTWRYYTVCKATLIMERRLSLGWVCVQWQLVSVRTLSVMTTLLSMLANHQVRHRATWNVVIADGQFILLRGLCGHVWVCPQKYTIHRRYFWFKYDLDRSTIHLQFDLTGVRTHDPRSWTVHFMSPRRSPSPLGDQGGSKSMQIENCNLFWWLKTKLIPIKQFNK